MSTEAKSWKITTKNVNIAQVKAGKRAPFRIGNGKVVPVLFFN
jgi:hypothetical protein